MGGRFLRGLGVSLVLTAACVGDSPTTQPTPDASNDAPASADAGSDAKADVVGPWTPAVLDGAGSLALWLEASSANVVVSSGNVGKWKDQSKNKTDAVNANTGPTVLTGAVNGHDALHFGVASVTLAIADGVVPFRSDRLDRGRDPLAEDARLRVVQGDGGRWGQRSELRVRAGALHRDAHERDGARSERTSCRAPGTTCTGAIRCSRTRHSTSSVSATSSSKMGLRRRPSPAHGAVRGFRRERARKRCADRSGQIRNINPQIDFDVAELSSSTTPAASWPTGRGCAPRLLFKKIRALTPPASSASAGPC